MDSFFLSFFQSKEKNASTAEFAWNSEILLLFWVNSSDTCSCKSLNNELTHFEWSTGQLLSSVATGMHSFKCCSVSNPSCSSLFFYHPSISSLLTHIVLLHDRISHLDYFHEHFQALLRRWTTFHCLESWNSGHFLLPDLLSLCWLNWSTVWWWVDRELHLYRPKSSVGSCRVGSCREMKLLFGGGDGRERASNLHRSFLPKDCRTPQCKSIKLLIWRECTLR